MNKNKKKISYKAQKVKHCFTGTKLTKYAGLTVVMDYLNKQKIGWELDEIFPVKNTNAVKYSNTQIILSIVLASLSGINRATRIANFTADTLVQKLLNLTSKLNKDVIGQRFKSLGQKGSVLFQEYTFKKVNQWIKQSKLKTITIDCDSTFKTVYGNQQGATKGYNPEKKGARCYNCLLAFLSELKIVVNNRFRAGSAHCSNGIISFIEQTSEIIPKSVEKIFFRADSGFFKGELFDLLEELGWDYLIKVSFMNLSKLLKARQWKQINANLSICEFSFKGRSWKRERILKAVRILTGYAEEEYFGKKQNVPIYDYFCYCSTLELNAEQLQKKYNERATSENWIEQIKNQLLAGKTITNDFQANDLLWQIAVFAYNISVMMRIKIKKYWKEEHNTFRQWFIELPARLLSGSRQTTMKIYENYYYRDDWQRLARVFRA